MELPDTCPICFHLNMVDWERMESRPLSKLYTVTGYHCAACGGWKPCFISNRQLDDSLRKLNSMAPSHPSFYYHLVKTMNRAKEIQRRGREMKKVADSIQASH